tara:strand:- start:4945 stop:6216 length:1272 start_codon:yes stop_codon:yes gene_type:complete
MAIGDFFTGIGQGIGRGLTKIGGYDPMQQVSPEEAARRRQEGLSALQRSLGRSSAILSGDPRRVQFAEEQMQRAEQDRLLQQLAQDPRYAEQIKLLRAGLDPRLAAGTPKAGSVERFGVYDPTTKKLIGTVLKTDTQRISELESQGAVVGALRSPTVGGKSAVSDPLRTITMGGKVVKNVRDSELTQEEIQKINEAGQVIQPLGFTEKMESSKDVDFSPIKSKYLATQNIIIKASELADKFVNEPSSALAVGTAAQFIDGVIQNIDAGSNLLSNAKDKKVYKYIQDTSTSLEGKDFSDLIQKASQASGVSGSRIRDLAYLFAAARGQEGRGLSDKDYENALKIVTGGVGAAGRSAVLKDVSTSLRDEFYRDINFDISTSENEAYVNQLKGLPELPYYVDPYLKQQTSTQGTSNIEALIQKYGD